eukprot:TRINITY_DN4690_c0_g3_i1.p1 TRINITY_DN4690_c0_g3~~TRINITY_DN4690_c0_g3_i1.p1  ORF type:complete len:186 (+),score=41.25 TRINITY_DN4690_c0_g3_i1:42-560(+)
MVLEVVSKIEKALKGKFCGGDEPNKDDVLLFNELLGEGNINLHRWVKQMTSYTESERKSWKGAGQVPKSIFSNTAAQEKDAAPEKPKIPKTAVVAEMTCKAGADLKKLESLIKEIRISGLEWGTFTAAGTKLTWKPIVQESMVSKQDIMDMTNGFANYVESSQVVTWKVITE